MTLPPPPSGNGGSPQYGGSPDPFGPPPQQPGAGSYGGPPQQGGPPQHHAPAWQPPQQQQPPHQQGPQQQPPSWAPQPGAQPPLPPKKRGNALKWGLGGIALLAIIGITATVSISLVKTDGNDNGNGNGNNPGTTQASGTSAPSSTPGGNSEFASADDTGPATIITEEPTCAAWEPINNSISAAQTDAKWGDQDTTIPASDWSPELRVKFETVSKAMTAAADKSIALAKNTPHRVMRELYEQFIAYTQAFSESLSTYTAADSHLANVAVEASVAILNVCETIKYKSAVKRGPLVPPSTVPTNVGRPQDSKGIQRFMQTADGDCQEWQTLYDNFTADVTPWASLDPNVPVDKWSADQHATINSILPVMQQYADKLERLGSGNSNPVVADFAAFSAQYWRAYIASMSTYTSADYYLAQVAMRLPRVIVQACQAFG